MRTPILLGLSALLGACASRQPDSNVGQTHYSDNASAVTTPEHSQNTATTLAPRTEDPAMSPHAAAAPRGDDQQHAAAPDTWPAGSNTNGTMREPAAASPAATAPPGASRPDADDTRVNERDRKGGTLTPMDQGNDKADIQLTQKIRQRLMADSSLSFTAKNVKIITVNGKVTLRGPAKTDAEHQSIVSQARAIAGASNVDDQIEVKK